MLRRIRDRHVLEMIRIWRSLAVIGLVALIGVPVTFFATIALLPLWSAIESRYGIESVGHSGPADWCFWTVFVIYLAGAWIFSRLFRDPR